MDGFSLEVLAKAHPSISRGFMGIYSADGLPKPLPGRRTSYIINTDKSTSPGSHWVALVHHEDGLCTYFDSAGRPPQGSILAWMRKHCRAGTYNDKQYQGAGTWLCGLYCLYFLHAMAHKRLGVEHLQATLKEGAWRRNDWLMGQFYDSVLGPL